MMKRLALQEMGDHRRAGTAARNAQYASRPAGWRRKVAGGGIASLAILCSCFLHAAEKEPVWGDAAASPPAEMRYRNASDCMARGRRYFGEGNYFHAAMQFEKVLELDSSNTAAAEYLKKCEQQLDGE